MSAIRWTALLLLVGAITVGLWVWPALDRVNRQALHSECQRILADHRDPASFTSEKRDLILAAIEWCRKDMRGE